MIDRRLVSDRRPGVLEADGLQIEVGMAVEPRGSMPAGRQGVAPAELLGFRHAFAAVGDPRGLDDVVDRHQVRGLAAPGQAVSLEQRVGRPMTQAEALKAFLDGPPLHVLDENGKAPTRAQRYDDD